MTVDLPPYSLHLKTYFVDKISAEYCHSRSDEFVNEVVDYFIRGEFGTIIIPFDDTEHISLEPIRYLLKGALRDALMLPSFGVVQKMIKVNNLMAVYSCSADTAFSIMSMRNIHNETKE